MARRRGVASSSQLTLIGGPGSSKTTLTRWLAVIFARREQAKPENLGAALADDRLPIALELRRFAERFVGLSQHTTQGYRQNLLLVTLRPHGYHNISLSAFQECKVKPFTPDDVVNFIWCQVLRWTLRNPYEKHEPYLLAIGALLNLYSIFERGNNHRSDGAMV